MGALGGQMYRVDMTFVRKMISALSFKCKCYKIISDVRGDQTAIEVQLY